MEDSRSPAATGRGEAEREAAGLLDWCASRLGETRGRSPWAGPPGTLRWLAVSGWGCRHRTRRGSLQSLLSSESNSTLGFGVEVTAPRRPNPVTRWEGRVDAGSSAVFFGVTQHAYPSQPRAGRHLGDPPPRPSAFRTGAAKPASDREGPSLTPRTEGGQGEGAEGIRASHTSGAHLAPPSSVPMETAYAAAAAPEQRGATGSRD